MPEHIISRFLKKDRIPKSQFEVLVENDRYRISRKKDGGIELYLFEAGKTIINVQLSSQSPEETAYAGINFYSHEVPETNSRMGHQEVMRRLVEGAKGIKYFIEAVEEGDLPRPNFIVGATNPRMARVSTNLGFMAFEEFDEVKLEFKHRISDEELSEIRRQKVQLAVTYDRLKTNFENRRETYEYLINRSQN